MDTFWSKTQPSKSGCVEWTGCVGNNGYGSIKIGGKVKRAHRVAYEKVFGQIPDGMFVLHKCDNRKCVNTDHLFIGTAQDNTDDMYSKGREKPPVNLKGELAKRAKLTEAIVVEIRSCYKKSEVPLSFFAEKFGVSISAIAAIIYRRSWTHV